MLVRAVVSTQVPEGSTSIREKQQLSPSVTPENTWLWAPVPWLDNQHPPQELRHSAAQTMSVHLNQSF